MTFTDLTIVDTGFGMASSILVFFHLFRMANIKVITNRSSFFLLLRKPRYIDMRITIQQGIFYPVARYMSVIFSICSTCGLTTISSHGKMVNLRHMLSYC